MPSPDGSIPPRVVVGAQALAALAVPARYALMSHLLAAGPRTASQCAEVIGETASNCSWHLRALAKVGLVEPAPPPADDARSRPWRATAAGFDFSGGPDPAGTLVQTALAAISAQHDNALHQRYLARRELLPAEWAAAGADNRYSLALTPDELHDLLAAVDALIRPYVRPLRSDAAPEARTVQLSLRAFLNPDVAESP